MALHTDSTVAAYIVLFDWDGANNPIYIGRAQLGADVARPVWQIRHLTFDASNNPLSILFANGSMEHDQKWTERAALSYA